MKRFFRVALLVGCCFLGAGSALSETAFVCNPKPTDRLNLRTQMSTAATSLGRYYNGVDVWVLSHHGDWAYVQIGQTKGYMQKAYLSFDVPVVSAIPTMVVTNPNSSDRLNLREGMSKQSASLGKYYNGTLVELLGYGKTWHHVRVGEQIGYMEATYLRDAGAQAQPPWSIATRRATA